MKTTLITAAGSAAAPAVLQSLRTLGHRVVGCDIYPREWNIVSCKVDEFFQAKLAAEADAYTAQLLDAVEREKIDYLIPLTDLEVDVLCARKERFAALGCIVCAPDEPAARLCRNKLAMAETLSVEGLCRTIPTIRPYGWEPRDTDFPLMLKPISGRSSQGQAVVRTREALASALHARKDYIAQPFLSGDVYTVDVARDAFGSVHALARRELLRTPNGLGTTVRILPGHPLEAVCAAIAQRAGIVGVVNMEFIHHEGEFYFLEVNPRLSGGAGFSLLAGVDFPMLNLLCHQGKPIGTRPAVAEMTLTRSMEPVRTGD